MAGRLLRVSEVAKLLAVSVTHVRRLIHSGKLQVVWVGQRSPRIPESALAAFLRGSQSKPQSEQ